VLSEKKILNETKNHTPTSLQVKWSVPYKIKDTSKNLHMVDSFIFKLYLKLLRNPIHDPRHTPVTDFINKSTVVMCLQPSKLEFGVEGRVTTTFTLSLSILINSSGDNDYIYMKELPLA
jgi:hypothetical protein